MLPFGKQQGAVSEAADRQDRPRTDGQRWYETLVPGVSKLQVLALLEAASTPEDPEPGSPSLKW